MRTCARLTALLIALSATIHAKEWTLESGVIVQQIGNSYLFVFPSNKGRIRGIAEPAGKIQVGSTISVVYSLKIMGGGKARFIGFDASPASTDPKPKLSVEQAYQTFGFLVKDANNPKLDVHVDPEFAKKAGKTLRGEKVAAHGNLYVTLGRNDGTLKITRVDLQ